MIKATVETSWIEQNAGSEYRAKNDVIHQWLNKTKLAWRRLVIQNNKSSIWKDYVLHQTQKASVVECGIKDEFFIGNYAGRKKIHAKTWKRHSAFLFYQQEISNLESKRALEIDQHNEKTFDDLVNTENRISFDVKSYRSLPIWATALNEMVLIDEDLSSLRSTNLEEVLDIAVKAA